MPMTPALENDDNAACRIEFGMDPLRIPRLVTRFDSQELRLLLLEDHLSDVYLAEEMLDSGMPDYGWHVTDKPSMAKALSVVHDVRFDMALVDLNVQDMEGIETVSVLHAAAPYLPIVVYSGISDRKLLEEALANGARFYIEKDRITPHALRHVIQGAMGRPREVS